MIEKFGLNEYPISHTQWLEIGKKMKQDHHISYKRLQQIAQAQHQSKRFQNLAYLTGAVLFLAFLKFPVIRIQPGFRRVGISAVLATPFYYYLFNLSQRIKVKRIKYAYRRHIVDNNLHPRVTI